ncbi:hypothetical protein LA521A_06910 [Lysobacter auxotrophicus]|uniref:Uncharacterized protein n=1 Tax=Lysobacter auxotrophicus TaxID=2992573 RepID=A0ABM8DAB4_9GAMM|nr:hypothetical protein LA521A_06910 [Lysobacter auxotrophicus]
MNLLSSWPACLALALVAPLHAGEHERAPANAERVEAVATQVPLILESPACEHEKLGAIEITIGEKVSEITQDTNVPTVDYGRAMDKLAAAAQQRGANAVVLRMHQGVYFTRSGKQSRKPVYVKLRGAAIHLSPEALAQCSLTPLSVAELEARSRDGKPQNVSSRTAFEDETAK